MMAGRIELLSAEHKGVNERNPRGIPYELGRLFSDTAGTTSETSINAVLSVMPKTNLLYGTDFGAARYRAAVEQAHDVARRVERKPQEIASRGRPADCRGPLP
jgi:hypothetical protein